MNDQVQEPQVQEQAVADTPVDPNEVQVIKANNPTKDEMVALRESIAANTEFHVDVVPTTFTFRKAKDAETGITSHREALVIPLPYPNIDGLMAILEAGGKTLELVLDAVADVIKAEAKEYISLDPKLDAGNFPYEKVSLDLIATKPKSTRGGGIAKEVWDAFKLDYISILMNYMGKDAKQANTAAGLQHGRLAKCQTNKEVLEILLDQITQYAGFAAETGSIEEFGEVVTFLSDKAKDLIQNEPTALLDSL